jgi:hypothetical protein
MSHAVILRLSKGDSMGIRPFSVVPDSRGQWPITQLVMRNHQDLSIWSR